MSDLGKNHFELFGLTPAFEIDEARLAGVYRDLQGRVHPDRFANASDQERRISMQQAAQINEAYQVLKTPLARARYLLELAGLDPDKAGDSRMDPAFLMEQMELRERLAGARTAADPLADVADLIDAIGHASRELVSEIGALFAGADEAALALAADRVRRLQFLNKLKEEAASLEADLEDELI